MLSTDLNKVVHKSSGAGQWFPGEKNQLKLMVNDFMDKAMVPEIHGRIVGALAPHAGYVYSGETAGYTFRAIRNNIEAGYIPDVVILLGFSHRGGFPGVALLQGFSIETPLGEIGLDIDMAERLAGDSSRIFFNNKYHIGEHSAENEIPFIQEVFPSTKIIVGLMGDHDEQTLLALQESLNRIAREKKILVIGSTDMLHHSSYDIVKKTDKKTLNYITTLDYESILSSWDYSNQVFCGIGPVITVMRFSELQGSNAGKVLHYINSGDNFPESRGTWVVGYSACVFIIPD